LSLGAADRRMRAVELFSPGADAGFFCFEPVSHAVDAFHLAGGPQVHGLKILRPGDLFGIECRFRATDDG
jgi:aldose 1-epimerase